MRSATLHVMSVVLLALSVACAPSRDEGEEINTRALDARIERLETRLDVLEKLSGRVQRLARDVDDLEDRLAAADAHAPAAASPPPLESPSVVPPTPGAPAVPGVGGQPSQNPWAGLSAANDPGRAAAIARLSSEYQTKLAQIPDRFGTADSPERQEALRDLAQWYREQLNALLASSAAGGEPER